MSIFNRNQESTGHHPLPLFSQLTDEINRLWHHNGNQKRRKTDQLGADWQPEVDVEQKNNMYIVKADIPGVAPQDIKVTMGQGNLIIEGMRESSVEENKDGFHCIERTYGNFYRSLKLPDASDSAQVEAHCKNGVLEIYVPVNPTAVQKKVEIMID